MKIKFGFTLAEVLITMAIIGVVAALTIPTLTENYQKKVYVTSLHKTYNDLSHALERLMSDKGVENLVEAGLRSDNAIYDFIDKYIKYNKKSTTAFSDGDPFASKEKYRKMFTNEILDGSVQFNDMPSYVLASGVSIKTSYNPQGFKLFDVLIDTNGPKAPNTVGRDLFVIFVYKNGLIDDFHISYNAPLPPAIRDGQYTKFCNNPEGYANPTNISGCFGKILNDNWQMKY